MEYKFINIYMNFKKESSSSFLGYGITVKDTV